MNVRSQSDDDDNELLLDGQDSEYAWSEGGDSLLDSEEEEEERGESTHGRQPSPPAPPPDPLLPTARVQPSPSHRKPQDSRNTSASPRAGRSKVIRLDGPRKFRCVDMSLSDVALLKPAIPPRKTAFNKPPAFTRPRRITRPSLLLDPKRLLVSCVSHDIQPDLRSRIVANRTFDLQRQMNGDKEKDYSMRSSSPTLTPPTRPPLAPPTLHHLTPLITGAPSTAPSLWPHPLAHPISLCNGPRIRQDLPQPSTSKENCFNPFLSALEEVKQQPRSDSLSFSLAHIIR